VLTNAGLPATIDTAVTPLKAFYRRANIRGDATLNPFVGIMKPAVRCELRDVVSSVLAAEMLDVLPPEDRRLWAVAFYAGLRRAEIIGLRPEDIDLATGVIHVRRGWDMLDGEVAPKSRKGKRKVPIPALHANIGITLDLYGHMFPGAEDEAAGPARRLLVAHCRAGCRADGRIPAMRRFLSDVHI